MAALTWQKQNQQEFTGILISQPSSSSKPETAVARFSADNEGAQLRFHQKPGNVIYIDLQNAQLFKLGPIQSMCISGGMRSNKKEEKSYSQAITIVFRTEDENRSFHCAFEQWKSELADGEPGNDDDTSDKKMMKWTTLMDKAFTEQLIRHAANLQSDNGLTKEKWNAISNALTAELGFKVHVKHLKNHVKHWKKQYFQVKELRGQSGFKWDEEKKLIDASGPVWDEYLKKHPEMARWRKQSLPNFHELALVMGEDCATGSSSVACNEATVQDHDEGEGLKGIGSGMDQVVELDEDGTADLNGELQGSNIDAQRIRARSLTPSILKESKNMQWTTTMNKAFMEQLIRNGANLKSDNGLSKEKWKAISNAMTAELGFKVDVRHLKNHLKHWKTQYFQVKELRGQSGFVWNEAKKLFDAPGPVWDEYLKKHPEMGRWRKQSLPNFNELALIMGEECAFYSPLIALNEATVRNHEEGEGVQGMDLVVEADDGMGDSQGPSTTSQGIRSRSSTPSTPREAKKKKNSTDDSLSESFGSMMRTLARMANNDEKRTIEIRTMKEELMKIPGIDKSFRFRAMNYLVKDEDMRRLFLELDKEDRMEWLTEFVQL